jgi:hypothetical protein
MVFGISIFAQEWDWKGLGSKRVPFYGIDSSVSGASVDPSWRSHFWTLRSLSGAWYTSRSSEGVAYSMYLSRLKHMQIPYPPVIKHGLLLAGKPSIQLLSWIYVPSKPPFAAGSSVAFVRCYHIPAHQPVMTGERQGPCTTLPEMRPC